jgi:hypothetical protein
MTMGNKYILPEENKMQEINPEAGFANFEEFCLLA